MKEIGKIVKMEDVVFDKTLLEQYETKTLLDELLSSSKGLPKGVNYMIIGDPGVGKTTVIIDALANIKKHYPDTRILFISAEMNEVDLYIYVLRYPKFSKIPILFVESDISQMTRFYPIIAAILDEGWDIVAIDSFSELQAVIKEEEGINSKESESKLLSLIKKHNKRENKRNVYTSFLTIQQVTKSGAFLGSNRLKHMITAMMELRLENPKNIYTKRYITFSKHRRGGVGEKLYYSLSEGGNVDYDHERFEQDKRIKQMQQRVVDDIVEYANQFNNLFNT